MQLTKSSKIYVTGHTGLAGSAVVRALKKAGYTALTFRTHKQLDLTDQKKTFAFINSIKPDCIIHCAARVGSITANIAHPAEFLYENAAMQVNVFEAAQKAGVKRLIFFGSNCVYPRLAKQPMKEEQLMTGPLEPTNEAYGVAKLAGLMSIFSYNQEYGTDWVSLIPATLYGPGDHFEMTDDRAHIISQLITLLHEAKQKEFASVSVNVNPEKVRDFLYIDDLADAVLFTLKNISVKTAKQFTDSVINLGTGEAKNIRQLAEIIKKIVGYNGGVQFKAAPTGMPRKVLDSTRMKKLGWQASTKLEEGLLKTYAAYLEQLNK